jgi:CDP-diacylglycerol--glycerol-3-phosphate 3-phosphatidyltransferase
MTTYALKPRFQELLGPVVAALAALGVRPNTVTIIATVGSIASGAALAVAPTSRALLLWLAIALGLRMVLNAIDGMLAIRHHMASPLGMVLNELGDLVSDAALYLPLACVPGVSAPPVIVAVVLFSVVEASSLCVRALGKERPCHGPMGKSDRALVVAALAAALALGVAAGPWVAGVFVAASALAVVTIVRRVRAGLAGEARA